MIQNNIWKIEFIERQNLIEFQWNLKKQDNEDSIEKLTKEILSEWFNAPLYIWNKDWEKLILDGHQRKKALNKLALDWHLVNWDKIPCILINAETEEKARRQLLEYNSKYSEFDIKELESWTKEMGELEELEIMELDIIESWWIEEFENTNNAVDILWNTELDYTDR